MASSLILSLLALDAKVDLLTVEQTASVNNLWRLVACVPDYKFSFGGRPTCFFSSSFLQDQRHCFSAERRRKSARTETQWILYQVLSVWTMSKGIAKLHQSSELKVDSLSLSRLVEHVLVSGCYVHSLWLLLQVQEQPLHGKELIS